MPLPIRGNKDDLDTVVNYLKSRSFGVSLETARATIGARLLESRKLNAFRVWGFIEDNDQKLKLTQRGHSYVAATEDEKTDIFREVLGEEQVYQLTLEWFYHQGFEQVSLDDVAGHWSRSFRANIGTESEATLKEQVTCFMSITDSAGLGAYKIGRRGQTTRFEIDKPALASFIERSSEAPTPVEQDTEVNLPSSDNNSIDTPPEEHGTKPMLLEAPAGNLTTARQLSPSIHIDIQIHIDSTASPDQIDQIFASMAKHLYKNE